MSKEEQKRPQSLTNSAFLALNHCNTEKKHPCKSTCNKKRRNKSEKFNDFHVRGVNSNKYVLALIGTIKNCFWWEKLCSKFWEPKWFRKSENYSLDNFSLYSPLGDFLATTRLTARQVWKWGQPRNGNLLRRELDDGQNRNASNLQETKP